jgi:hypothetical protein
MRFLNVTLLAVLHRQNTYGAVWAKAGYMKTLPQGFLMGCKDIGFLLNNPAWKGKNIQLCKTAKPALEAGFVQVQQI